MKWNASITLTLLLAACSGSEEVTDGGGVGADAGAGLNQDGGGGFDAGGVGSDGGGGGAFDAGGPPPTVSCMASSECAQDEICGFDSSDVGRCMKAPNQDCNGRQFCYDNRIGFDGLRVPGDLGEGPDCIESCPRAEGGHQLGVCADVGGRKTCVPLCQYPDDTGCVLDPERGISSSCSRQHARLLAATRYVVYCATDRQITGARCRTSSFQPGSDMEAGLQCFEALQNRFQFNCRPLFGTGVSCVNDFNDDASISTQQLLDASDANLDITASPAMGGGGSSGGTGNQQCGTDCDCGRCSYCEKSGGDSVCRYGGEGPYGCYRGCN